ncbi:hypothetical protein F8271_09525 [Micromonospora sp. ALFpr18c]|nr:hypothetical protein F8271_09525 [Micromonospora sp. ALFpr18c]
MRSRPHPSRDVTFRKDLHKPRIGIGPAVLTALPNTSSRCPARRRGQPPPRPTVPHDIIVTVTSAYPITH